MFDENIFISKTRHLVFKAIAFFKGQAAMLPTLSIRITLLIALATLNAIIGITLGVDVYRAAVNYSGTQKLQKASDFSNTMFMAEKHLAEERSWSLAALFLKDAPSQASLDTRRMAADAEIVTALAILNDEEKSQLALLLQKIDSDQEALRAMRNDLDDILSAQEPKKMTKAQLKAVLEEESRVAGDIVSTTTDLINNIHIVIEEYQRPLLSINPSVARQMRFSHVVSEVTEYASREYTVLGQLIAGKSYPSDATREQLALWRGRINYGWDLIHSAVLNNGMSAEAKPAMDEAETHYFSMFEHIKDIFSVDPKKKTPDYPLTMEKWLAMTSEAVNALYAMNEATLHIGESYMAQVKSDAQWKIFFSLLLFICAMGVSLYFWRQITLRVVRPVDHMARMLYSATEGVYEDIPKFQHYPEEIAKLAMVLSVMQENSKQLEAERDKAQAASLAKSEFITNVSHELRTPMNVMLGLSEILSRTEPLTDQQRQFINTLRSSGKSLLTLINDLLDLSSIESGKVDVALMPFDLHELAVDLQESMPVGARERGIETKAVLSGIKGKKYVGDAIKIRQIIVNLYGNALKFTEHGQIIFSVQAKPISKREDSIKIEISDTGIGIPQDKLPIVFDKFTQVDSSLTRKFGGTGLGLAITKSLVEMMDGTVKVASKEGQGSTFTVNIVLPAA